MLAFAAGTVLQAALATPTGAAAQADPQGPAAKTPNAPKEKKPKKARVEFLWVPRPSLRVGKQLRVDFKAKYIGEIQRSDVPTTTAAGTADQSLLDVARRRIGLEGQVMKAVSFQVERELPNTSEAWRDVFVDYDQFTFARMQYGKFKLPFSVDENTGATNLDFAFRSLAASELSPGRDRGWMFHGQVLNHGVGYEYGVFDHDGHNAQPSLANADRVTGGSTKAYRVRSQPFRSVKSKWTDLEVGYASTKSDPLAEGFSSIRGQTVLGHSFYKSKFLVNGVRQRTGYELRFRPGPFSLKWESIRVTEERLGVSVEDKAASPLLAKGWYISGSWAVTGETKSNGLEEPKHPLLTGGVGAIEVAARVERIWFGSIASEAAPEETGSTSVRADVVKGNSDRVLTFGVNWYPTRWVKIQVNLIKEEIADPSQGPLPEQPSFWSRVIRFQVGF